MRRAIAVTAILVTALAVSGWSAQPAAASATATVHGVVTAPGGGAPDAPVTVTLGSTMTTQTAPDGSYAFTGLTAGTYNLVFDYTGSSKIVRHEHWDGTFGSVNAGIVLSDGEDRDIDVHLVVGADVSGAVTGVDGPLDATTKVTLVWRGGGLAYGTPGTFDVASQTWRVADVAPGVYSVIIRPAPRWNGSQWGGLQVASGVDFVDTAHQLARSNEIGGVVSYVDGDGVTQPLPDGIAWATISTSGVLSAPIVNGRYDIYGVWGNATYSVCFQEIAFVALTCVGGGHDMYNSPAVTVAEGQALEHVDQTVVRGGLITGKLTGVGSPQWEVRLLRFDPGSGTYGSELYDYPPASTSEFGFSAVVPGRYRLQVIDTSNANNAQYWSGARYAKDASDIVVTSGQTIDLGTIVGLPRTVDTSTRLGGADRFAVSVAVSKALFPTVPAAGVPVVYVANGLNFPDALSAGPAAIKQGGGLLLVTPSSIPSAVQVELARLRPQRIVVVGGPASVSDAVLHQLDADVTGSSGAAVRLTGTDRFDASRNLTRTVFTADGAATVFIATGNDYPDALSAGPAAGSIGAPVVLVNGLAPHLDSATIALLHELRTTQVDIVGGYASVSFGIVEDLQTVVGDDHVTVFGGPTRYENAAQIGETFFRYTDNALFATGINFPDALSAATLAGAQHAPIDLVQTNCIPLSVGYWVGAQQVQHVTLVGGPASLGQGVASLTPCAS